MIVGDILRITQYFEQAGNQALMVSFWEVDGFGTAPASEAELARWYHLGFHDAVGELFLSNTAFATRTVVDNLSGGLAYGDYSEPLVGIISGDAMASFVAIDVKQEVGSRLTRAGRKRLPFVSEQSGIGNTVVMTEPNKAAIETWFGEVAQVANPLDPAQIVVLTPVIIGRVESPPDSGNYVIDISIKNPVVDAVVVKITSQNSRKP